MSYYAVLLNAEFGYSRGQTVKADRYLVEKETVRFFLEDRLVYQVPARFVRDIQQFANQAEVTRFFKEARRQHKERWNLSVEEVGPIRRSRSLQKSSGQGGIPAENISCRVEEIGRARKG